jgi:hypothetical protein
MFPAAVTPMFLSLGHSVPGNQWWQERNFEIHPGCLMVSLAPVALVLQGAFMGPGWAAVGQKVEYELATQYDGAKTAINVTPIADSDSEVIIQACLQRLFLGSRG